MARVSEVAIDVKNVEASPYLDPESKQFVKGNPGRPKGAVGQRTREKQELFALLADGYDDLPSRAERLKKLLQARSESVRLETERLVLAYEWGLPKQTLNLEGQINIAALLLAAHARINGGNGNGGKP
jgi:hypothetical protein